MTKLTSKTRNQVETLLNTFSDLCSIEAKIGKRGMDFGITVSNQKNDSDFAVTTINTDLAKEAIKQQKAIVAGQLSKFGIQV